MDRVEHTVQIKRIDEDQRVVFGEVYAPFVLDTWGELMLPEDVTKLAHRFMQMSLGGAVDTMHDERPNGSFVLESFIARENDPDYTTGAWVLGVKVIDENIWSAIRTGKLSGYSFQGLVKKLPAVIEIDVLKDNVGITEPGGSDDHVHLFLLELDDDGRVMAGRTTTDNGHSHLVMGGTATDPANGHSHRIFI